MHVGGRIDWYIGANVSIRPKIACLSAVGILVWLFFSFVGTNYPFSIFLGNNGGLFSSLIDRSKWVIRRTETSEFTTFFFILSTKLLRALKA